MGCLFDCLELLLSATDGKLSVYDERLIQQLGRFMDKIHVSGPHFLNFADADAHVSKPSPHLLRTYGERIQSPEMISLAETVAALPSPAHPPPGEDHASLIRVVPTLFPHRSFPVLTTQLLARDVWPPEGQIMVARVRENDPTGFTLAMKGGHNGESHGHLDVGSIAVYHDGEPVIIDVRRELYRRNTSLARYELWYAQSAYHNVPTTNETEQAVGPRRVPSRFFSRSPMLGLKSRWSWLGLIHPRQESSPGDAWRRWTERLVPTARWRSETTSH